MRTFAIAFAVLLCATAAALAQPVVTANGMVNAASAIEAGLPNGDVAQGSIFSIYGKNMGPATWVPIPDSWPLPTSGGLGGVTVQVKDSAGTSRYAVLLGLYAGQINAILPSATATGQASLTVTYNGQTSAPQTFNVVAKSVGLFARNSAGSGPGAIQVYHGSNPSFNDITNSAYPSDVAVLYGTGLGAVSGGADQNPPVQTNLGTVAQVWLGGQQVPAANIAWEGRTPDAGLDQINFTIPANAPQGCYVPVSVVINGIVSNTVSMSIMANGGMCSDSLSSYGGLTASQLQQNGLRLGSVAVNQTTASVLGISKNSAGADAAFDKFNWAQLAASRGGLGISVLGACTVFTFSGGTGDAPDPIAPTYLDPGTLTLTTPSGSAPLTKQSTGVYSATLTYPLAQGSYTVTASGGADVGAFTSTLTLPAPFTWMNMSSFSLTSPVALSQGLTVTWSGGGGKYVEIMGYSGVQTPQVAGAMFICLAPVSAGTFTVPPNVLLALPPSQLGALILSNSPASNTFNPNPPSGLDVGAFSAGYSSMTMVSYQ